MSLHPTHNHSTLPIEESTRIPFVPPLRMFCCPKGNPSISPSEECQTASPRLRSRRLVRPIGSRFLSSTLIPRDGRLGPPEHRRPHPNGIRCRVPISACRDVPQTLPLHMLTRSMDSHSLSPISAAPRSHVWLLPRIPSHPMNVHAPLPIVLPSGCLKLPLVCIDPSHVVLHSAAATSVHPSALLSLRLCFPRHSTHIPTL